MTRGLGLGLLAAVLALGAIAAARPVWMHGLWQAVRRQVWVARAGDRFMRDVAVAMPDGVSLATDVYLPGDTSRPVPALLIRLPYGKDAFEGALWWVRAYVPRGYAVVVQDLRGRHGSGGVFAPYAGAVEDGAATLDWIAAQPWSDGAWRPPAARRWARSS